MFSEAYKNLCELHRKKLREEWEPKFGDWVKSPGGLGIVLSHLAFPHNNGLGEIDIALEDGHMWRYNQNTLIPLPTPRQLWRMLEERGHEKWQITNTPLDPCSIEVDTVFAEGPDPETALLKCLSEVCAE